MWWLISLYCGRVFMIRNRYTPTEYTLPCKKIPPKYHWATTLSRHTERRRIPLVSHIICLSFSTLVAWSRFNNSWGLTDSKTYKRMWWNVSHVVEAFLWWACRMRGVTLFNYIQLTTPVCLQGHPGPSSGLIWLPLQRKYEYELLFAQL